MSKLLSTYTVLTNGKIAVRTAYHEDIAKQCRAWGGSFLDDAWVLSGTRLPEVQARLGVAVGDPVEIEVGADDWNGLQQLRVGWYVLAARRTRDGRATVYAEQVAGTIPASGGSVKNPRVSPSEDVRFRLWVPRDFAEARELTIVNGFAGEPLPPEPPAPESVARVRALMAELGVTLADLAPAAEPQLA